MRKVSKRLVVRQFYVILIFEAKENIL